MNVTWTEERIARLTELWLSGMAARLIGAALGVTKSAVVGKASRLGLPNRDNPIKCGGKVTRAQPKLPSPRKAFDDRRPKWMASHRMVPGARFRECQWIAGEKGVDFKLYDQAPRCPAETLPGSPYCPAHHLRCHVKTQSQEAA